jgi:hypothetical protein
MDLTCIFPSKFIQQQNYFAKHYKDQIVQNIVPTKGFCLYTNLGVGYLFSWSYIHVTIQALPLLHNLLLFHSHYFIVE